MPHKSFDKSDIHVVQNLFNGISPSCNPPPLAPGRRRCNSWGHFRTAPIITLLIPGAPLKTTHLQKHA